MRLSTICLLFFIFTAILLFSACNNAPSPEVIKTAISDSVKQSFPQPWSGKLLKGTLDAPQGKNAQVELVEVKEIGQYNAEKKSWPVKARVKGTFLAEKIIKEETQSFDHVGVFQVFQDEFQKWKATFVRSDDEPAPAKQ